MVFTQTVFTDHKPCPLSVEAEKKVAIQTQKMRFEVEKNRIEADKVKKDHEIELKRIRAGMSPVS